METIFLNVEKSLSAAGMACHVARPEQSSPKKAIIVLQEAFGVNAHVQGLVKKFAKEGFLAIAPELFHRTAPVGFSCAYTDFQAVVPHLDVLTEQTMTADVKACYDWLSKDQQVRDVAAIGYCLGGRAAFIANASIPLKAAVSYYGGRIGTHHLPLAAKQNSPLLMFWGGLDKHIPPEQIQAVTQALSAANKPFMNVVVSWADHGFFCDDRPAFNPQAARQSSALTMQFLQDWMS